jgi:hypothetical protein
MIEMIISWLRKLQKVNTEWVSQVFLVLVCLVVVTVMTLTIVDGFYWITDTSERFLYIGLTILALLILTACIKSIVKREVKEIALLAIYPLGMSIAAWYGIELVVETGLLAYDSSWAQWIWYVAGIYPLWKMVNYIIGVSRHDDSKILELLRSFTVVFFVLFACVMLVMLLQGERVDIVNE